MSRRSGISGWAPAVVSAVAVIFAAGVYAEPIQIATFADLRKIGVDAGYPLDGDYELAANIDASASRGQDGGFTPIGRRAVTYTDGFAEVVDSTAAFRGSFDGKGFEVSGLYINRPGYSDGTCVGLFGFAYGARISNVAVAADTVAGYSYAGALLGRGFRSVIEGCRVSGAVSGHSNVGGLVGGIEGTGSIASSYSSASVNGTSYLGGLVGSVDYGSVVGCYSLGPVAVTGDGGRSVGGLAGSNRGAGQVSSCYSMSPVSGAGASAVGGLVGENSESRITMSYSAGPVSGAGAGGFVGDNSGQIFYSYMDTGRSGQTAAVSGVTARTSAEMTRSGSYTWNFNSDTLWGISNNYPYLKKLPFSTVTFTVAPGGGTVGGSTVHAQRANFGVDGAAVAAEVSDSGGGESFDGWYLGGEKLAARVYDSFAVTLSGSGGTVTVSGLTGGANVDIEARFTMKTYRLTYIAGPNGKVRREGAAPDSVADTVVFLVGHGQPGPQVRAVPSTGYRFSRWTWRDTSAVRADTAWNDTAFEAKFVGATLTLRYGTSNRLVGRLRVNDAQGLVETTPLYSGVPFGGTGPKVEAETLNDSTRFVMWSDGLTNNPRVDSLLRDNIDVLAIFAVSTFALTYAAGEGGKIAVAVGGADTAVGVFADTVEYNKSGRHVTAVPDSGYVFAGWSDNRTDSSRIDSLVRRDMDVTARFERIPDAVKSSGRIIPNTLPNDEIAIVRPLTITAGEFAAGPNPVLKQSGLINFFWNGKLLDNGFLFIYDMAGNVAVRIAVSDNIVLSGAGKRKVASWDLTDGNGRAVPGGTYLVRGILSTGNGAKEKVSVIFGVR